MLYEVSRASFIDYHTCVRMPPAKHHHHLILVVLLLVPLLPLLNSSPSNLILSVLTPRLYDTQGPYEKYEVRKLQGVPKKGD